MSAPVLLLSDVTREHVQGDAVVHALRGVDLVWPCSFRCWPSR